MIRSMAGLGRLRRRSWLGRWPDGNCLTAGAWLTQPAAARHTGQLAKAQRPTIHTWVARWSAEQLAGARALGAEAGRCGRRNAWRWPHLANPVAVSCRPPALGLLLQLIGGRRVWAENGTEGAAARELPVPSKAAPCSQLCLYTHALQTPGTCTSPCTATARRRRAPPCPALEC